MPRERHPNLIAGQQAWLAAKVELTGTSSEVVYLRACRCDRCSHWRQPAGDLRKRGVCGLTGKAKGRNGTCGEFKCGWQGTVEACLHTGVLDGEIEKRGIGKQALYSIAQPEALRLSNERRARRNAKRADIAARQAIR